MSPEHYRAIREGLGSRAVVGRALGVAACTVAARELGRLAIRVEVALAMRWLERHGLHHQPEPRREVHALPGELREALGILGWDVKTAARVLLGPGDTRAQSLSRMLTGSRPVSERVARLVKVRLGLTLEDPWPKREGRDWSLQLPEGMEGMR